MEQFHIHSVVFHILAFLTLSLFLEFLFVNCNTLGHCLQKESSTLLQLKRDFTSGELDTWQSGTDCCIWEGVTCDKSRRVTGLDLSNRDIGGKINRSLFNLTSLQSLNFAHNHFDGMPILDYGWDNLANLSRLNLSSAIFSGNVPSGLSHLTKLTSLDLSFNFGLFLTINATILRNMSNLRELYLDYVNLSGIGDAWCGVLVNSTPILEALSMKSCSLIGASCSSLSMLPFLSILNLGGNILESSILNSFVNLTSLSELQVAENKFRGVFPKQILQLKKLKYFDISNNPMLSGSLPDFSESSNLEILNIYATNFSGVIPDTIGKLKFLIWIDLSRCQFTGRIPPSMGNLSQLEVFDLSYNNFNDVVGLEFIKNLLALDLSNSGFSLSPWDADDGSLSSFFPNMSYLGLATCNLTKIPGFLKYQHHLKFMQYLDISNNRIQGEISSLIWSIPSSDLSHNFFTHVAEPQFNFSSKNLFYTDLNSNMLEGHLPPLPKVNITFLDLSNNRFISFIPFNISPHLSLAYVSFANNNITGEIPTSICNLTKLSMLDLSNNKLIGIIPSCLLGEHFNLNMINLRGNQLHGAIPHQISPKCMLQTIILNDNQLEGMLPRALSNCLLLDILDLQNNNLKDTFPYWLGNLSSLRVLILRSNKFYGLVGPPHGNHEINHTFPMLHILDISSNNFNGNICEEYFNNFKSMMGNGADRMYNFPYFLMGYYYDPDALTIIKKGQVMRFQKFWMMVKSIDFSNNHFEGEIPISISQLVSLQVLNLSQNYLRGEIPPQLGKLSQLESLDLSMNSLIGKIPQNLVSLSFLSYLNLSYNKLEGKIPSGGQFSTFPDTSFEGNNGLCRFPCNTSGPVVNNTMASALGLGATTSKNKSYMIVLGILFGVGFGVSMAIVILIDVIWCDKSRKRRNMRTIHG